MTRGYWKTSRWRFVQLTGALCALTFFVFAFIPRMTHADGALFVSPAVIDRKATVRDILSEHVTIRNVGPRKITLYPVVEDVSVVDGRQDFADPSRADLSSSLAHWISLSRGAIYLESGEERSVDFEIRVNLHAQPDTYHAVILFPDGGSRAEAEAKIQNAPGSTFNLEIVDSSKEVLQIKSFVSDSKFFSQAPFGFSFELQNTGDVPLVPQGDILIYDRTGKEVADLLVNVSGNAIQPAVRQAFSASWPDALGIGNYKALLSIRYGVKTTGQLTDNAFFWVLPFSTVLGILFVLAVLVGGVMWYFHARFERAHARLKPVFLRASIPPSPPSPQVDFVVDLRNMDDHSGHTYE